MIPHTAHEAPATDAGAGEAWATLRMLFGLQRRRFLIAASELNLHPAQAGTLLNLDPEIPMPMHELATRLACDNSNVTGLVDRLETRGLVSRESSPDDRRVKRVVLTRAGRELRDELLSRVARPPQGLTRLPAAEQAQLAELLRRVAGEA